MLTSPQKLREVVYMIKNLSPVNAVDRLPFTHKKAAEELGKVIKSAVANAKQMGAQESELVFKAIEINEGPRLKRFRAGSRGRAKPYARRMSHIRVVVETKPLPKVESVKTTEEVQSSKGKVQNDKSKVKSVKKVIKKGVKADSK